MGGSWVKHVELDIAMQVCFCWLNVSCRCTRKVSCLFRFPCVCIFQRLYCLSERNVVVYDMMGCELFQVKKYVYVLLSLPFIYLVYILS